jgi:phytoene/squalene synthetase
MPTATHTHLTGVLARRITRQASMQTYTTIRTLVPHPRQDDAYRAYAYFRWLDDLLDGGTPAVERAEILAGQQRLLYECLEGRPRRDLRLEESMLLDLTRGSMGQDSGLQIYLKEMMAVMVFDAGRRDKRVSALDLEWYSGRLATAVTEAVYAFLGDAYRAPCSAPRYMAAHAAHIVHMLRDLHQDLQAGYYNIPLEILPGNHIRPADLASPPVQEWVYGRVQLAHSYFTQGGTYLAAVANPRCRVAGALYAARFEGVLVAIEREGFRLRADYRDCMGRLQLPRLTMAAISAAFNRNLVPHPSSIHPGLVPAPLEWTPDLSVQAPQEELQAGS